MENSLRHLFITSSRSHLINKTDFARSLLKYLFAELGTKNIISKAQRNKAKRSFQPIKAQRKMHNLIFEAQRNFAMKFLIQ